MARAPLGVRCLAVDIISRWRCSTSRQAGGDHGCGCGCGCGAAGGGHYHCCGCDALAACISVRLSQTLDLSAEATTVMNTAELCRICIRMEASKEVADGRGAYRVSRQVHKQSSARAMAQNRCDVGAVERLCAILRKKIRFGHVCAVICEAASAARTRSEASRQCVIGRRLFLRRLSEPGRSQQRRAPDCLRLHSTSLNAVLRVGVTTSSIRFLLAKKHALLSECVLVVSRTPNKTSFRLAL